MVLLLALLLSTYAAGAKPMPPKELAEFLGPVSPKTIAWTKTVGSDFDAYYGRAMPPLSGTVNIHIGGWPHFKRDAKSADGRRSSGYVSGDVAQESCPGRNHQSGSGA